MKLREFPGALALGLLASLAAHAALFGGSHEVGGTYHAELLTLAAAALGGFLLGFGALAWSGRGAADGSILAARLTQRLPGIVPLLGATGFWFALGERLEPNHAGPGLWLTVLALAAAAATLLALARGVIRLLAGAAFAIARTRFAPRTPQWLRLQEPALVFAPAPSLRRRFARPPPSANERA